jgi:iron only hydrogenase large subunit-like protein
VIARLAGNFVFPVFLILSGPCVAPEPLFVETRPWVVFLEKLDVNKTCVVSVSAQSRASLAAHFLLSLDDVQGKLITLFNSVGVSEVFDVSFARQLALIESFEEFWQRRSEGKMPMIIGSCPGFVTRAESSYHDFILPMMSTTKSPQQV